MSTDKKLNKYLAKLKNTHNAKDAKVYISKIMKYKQMTGKQSGGEGEFGEFTDSKQQVDNAATLLANLKNNGQIESVLNNQINNTVKSMASSGYTDDQITDALSESFGNLHSLLRSISKLDTNDIPSLEEISDMIQTAFAQIKKGETKTSEQLRTIIQEIWDGKTGTKKNEEAKVEEVEEAEEEAKEEAKEGYVETQAKSINNTGKFAMKKGGCKRC